MWPFKSLKNILLFIAFLSLLITFIIPNEIFKYDNSPNAQFFITYLFMLKSIVAIVIFFGFSLGKNFKQLDWFICWESWGDMLYGKRAVPTEGNSLPTAEKNYIFLPAAASCPA